MNQKIAEIAGICLEGAQIDREQIDRLLAEAENDLCDLLYWANRIREKFFADKVKICSIVPGRLGGCNQDCKFCAQSTRYKTPYAKARLISDEQILDAAKNTKAAGVTTFGIVYSGRTVGEKELARLRNLISQIRNSIGLNVCASLGVITARQAASLVDAGLTRYNHNLETSERHFANIVTTHRYSDRVETIEAVNQAGLRVCAGGIFGIGEPVDDTVQMALQLRRLDVDAVPMNFLHPIEGTPLAGQETLEPRQILKTIALYRFMLPNKTLKIAGGRALNLRDLQSWMFYAGANAILSGNYLTTTGRAVKEDLQMLADLGLQQDTD